MFNLVYVTSLSCVCVFLLDRWSWSLPWKWKLVTWFNEANLTKLNLIVNIEQKDLQFNLFIISLTQARDLSG